MLPVHWNELFKWNLVKLIQEKDFQKIACLYEQQSNVRSEIAHELRLSWNKFDDFIIPAKFVWYHENPSISLNQSACLKIGFCMTFAASLSVLTLDVQCVHVYFLVDTMHLKLLQEIVPIPK